MESCKESTVDDAVCTDADDSIDTLGEDGTCTPVLLVEGGESGGKVGERMVGEEESEGLDKGESGTLAVSVIKCEEIFGGDCGSAAASSGNAEGWLYDGDGCA